VRRSILALSILIGGIAGPAAASTIHDRRRTFRRAAALTMVSRHTVVNRARPS
jgi:hypothetical protein